MAKGYNPAIQQFSSARRSVMAAISGVPIANRFRGRGARLVHTGELNPQPFSSHPRILLPDPNEVGISLLPTNEASQVAPAGWDGESSAAAPAISKTI